MPYSTHPRDADGAGDMTQMRSEATRSDLSRETLRVKLEAFGDRVPKP